MQVRITMLALNFLPLLHLSLVALVICWIKPSLPSAKYYPGGFTNEMDVVGSIYPPPGTSNVLSMVQGALTVQGANLSTAFTNLVASTGYTFNPATGNTAAVTFPPVTVRFVKLTFTANTGWPAGQLSELMVCATR